MDTAFAGRSFPLAEPYLVGVEKVREFADAIGERSPLCHDRAAARSAGHPDVVAPPTFAIAVIARAQDAVLFRPELGLDFSRVVHRDQRFTHHRPIHAGDELRATVHIDAIRVLAGNDVIDLRTEVSGGDGAPVVTCLSTLVSRAPSDAGAGEARRDADVTVAGPGRGARSEPWAPSDAGAGEAPAVTVGQELPALTVHVDRGQLVRYAGASGDFNPIHWNARVATSVGLPDVIAHGMLTMALAGRLVTDWIGDPARVVDYGVRFTRPVVVPDPAGAEVTVAGRVAEINAVAQTARVDITATVDGQTVLAKARAVVRLPAKT